MEDVTLVLETDEETSVRIKQALEDVAKTDVISGMRENLDGGLATFVTILQASSPIIVAVIPLVTELVKQRKVRRMKLNNSEIESPTEEQLNRVWRKLETPDGKTT